MYSEYSKLKEFVFTILFTVCFVVFEINDNREPADSIFVLKQRKYYPVNLFWLFCKSKISCKNKIIFSQSNSPFFDTFTSA
jgi:hypothetical protein